jgi:hypothetical protein
MRVFLDLLDPSMHWVALARVIERNPDLPPDVTMVVRKDGVFLRDANGRVLDTEVPLGRFQEGSVARLEGKLAVLEWIHTRFPEGPAVGDGDDFWPGDRAKRCGNESGANKAG